MSAESTARQQLVLQVGAAMVVRGSAFEVGWEQAEAFVAGLEGEPSKPVACPCCEKQVVMCSRHYLLHEPGKKCTQCWDEQ